MNMMRHDNINDMWPCHDTGMYGTYDILGQFKFHDMTMKFNNRFRFDMTLTY